MHKAYECAVTDVVTLTENNSQIILKNSIPNYLAGQYVQVLADQTSVPLSIACKPNPLFLEFHLNHHTENRLATVIYEQALQKKYWQLTGPFGHCTINQLELTRPLIFIAYDTGFAPIKAILEELIPSLRQKIHFYWMVKQPEELYMQSLITRWQQDLPTLMFAPVFYADFPSKSAAASSLADAIIKLAPTLNHDVYVSGPKPFVTFLFSALSACGLKRENFYSDVFEG